MTDTAIAKLCDTATEAHTQIQKNFDKIDPVVGVSHKMRESGLPIDVMTIDCLKTKKRIILLLHDKMPDIIRYQFSFVDKDPSDDFEQIDYQAVTAKQLYAWMKDYFSPSEH